MDETLVHMMEPEELRALLNGSSELDLNQLQQGSRYEGYTSDSAVILWLWEILKDLDQAMIQQFLTFCTGCERAPIAGLQSVQLTISKNGNGNDRLPTSHTCFNVLLLPEYESKEVLNERLQTAIGNSEGFGMI